MLKILRLEALADSLPKLDRTLLRRLTFLERLLKIIVGDNPYSKLNYYLLMGGGNNLVRG